MKTINLFSNLIIMIINIFFFQKCTKSTEDKIITIIGNLNNLPDGEMSLLNVKREIISTAKSSNGHFQFSISDKDYPEPILVEIQHIDKANIKRLFHYKTKKIFKGENLIVQYFMLEENVVLEGNVEELLASSLPKNIKFLKVPIIAGLQTKVMYNDSLNFVSISKISQLNELIKYHPYSYYYLYELKKRVADFSNQQILLLLNSFNTDVQKSKTGRELRKYIENRNNKKLDFTTELLDRKDQKQLILDKKASINMIILWASWCGPCRKEIPQLKKVYEQFSGNVQFNMVSVSVDDNKENWYKAIDKEQMPWKQVIITPEATTYSKELFSFDGSIPTTLFVDNEGQIIKKIVGYDEKSLDEFTALIRKYAVAKN